MAFAVNMAGHDANFAFIRGDHPGAVRTHQPGLRAVEGALHRDHVEHRNALGDADDKRNFRRDRLQDGIGGKGRRHINDRSIGARLLVGLGDRIEDRQGRALGRLARGPDRSALARRHAADHFCAIGDGLFRVESAGFAGQALTKDLGVFIDENGHERSGEPTGKEFSRV